MKLETKYSCGDRVYRGYAANGRKRIDCAECAGTGRMKLEGKDFTLPCPRCGGDGAQYEYEARPATQLLTIGQVRIEYTNSPGTGDRMFTNYSAQTGYKESYMAVETGVGSGNVWDADDLFLTAKEAEQDAMTKHQAWKVRRAEEQAKEDAARAKRLAELEAVDAEEEATR